MYVRYGYFLTTYDYFTWGISKFFPGCDSVCAFNNEKEEEGIL